ncbi:MAG TPA: FkbM family methyltransferase [Xanthobacteraceae bacterium]|nr:FkbM family methyltransferase [Xanthobacteraceae bacterium]
MTFPRPLGMLAFLCAHLAPWRPLRTRAAASRLVFYVHHRDAIGRHIAKYGAHEPLLTSWLEQYLAQARPGLFIDVGANIGWHALHAARQVSVETVVAFEPDPFNFALLEQNATVNRFANVICKAVAIGDRPGTLRLYRYKSSNLGRHSAAVDHGYGWQDVPMFDLDGALAEMKLDNRAVAALKIDVEGFEPAVIHGARGTLARTDVLIIEHSPDLSRAAGWSADLMIAQLAQCGFRPHVLRAAGGVAAITPLELRSFTGVIDIIWTRAEARGVALADRGRLSLPEIAEQNSRVKAP